MHTSLWLFNSSQVRRETCQPSGNMMYSIYTLLQALVCIPVCVCVCLRSFAPRDCAAVRGGEEVVWVKAAVV